MFLFTIFQSSHSVTKQYRTTSDGVSDSEMINTGNYYHTKSYFIFMLRVYIVCKLIKLHEKKYTSTKHIWTTLRHFKYP